MGICSSYTMASNTASIPYTVAYNGESYTYNDIDTVIELIAEQDSYMEAAHLMAQGARALDYTESHEVIQLAKAEYNEAYELKQEYQEVYDTLMDNWHQKEEEYPIATYIWDYFKDLGYNDQVCAGILGNIMAEVGAGGTLVLSPYSTGNGYYGMCQWNQSYKEVWGASLEEQCNYLRDTIEYNFNVFGYAYKKDFTYADFLALEDSTEAALAFAKVYERCGSGTYYARQQNAITAYNYFVCK